MKKIIKGKVYDTSTAKLLGVKSHGDNHSDFSYYEESLYIKRSGEYFLYGQGGPMTRYAVKQGDNSWGWGDEIMPLSYEKARSWTEENLGFELFDEIFGAPNENDEDVTFCITLSASLNSAIRAKAAKTNQSVSACINEILRESLK